MTRPAQEDGEAAEDHDSPHETKLLADDGEDEVGVRLRQVEVLLLARHEALPQDPSGAHGNERLEDLEPLPQRILTGIEEDEEPLAPVLLAEDEPEEHRCGRQSERREVPERNTGDEEETRADEDQTERRPVIGLDEHQKAEEAGDQERREPAGPEVLEPVAAAVELVSERHHERKLRELRRLERYQPQADPAMGVVERRAEEHRDQQGHRRAQKSVDHRGTSQHSIVEARENDHEEDAHRRPHALLHREEVGTSMRLEGHDRDAL
jgi:hypothetical protein